MANKAKNKTQAAKTETTSKGVKFSFAGEYYTGSKTEGAQIKQYAIDIVFPEYTPKALSLFKTGLKIPNSTIRKLMIAKYPDFRTVRTHTITGVTDLSGKTRNTNNVSVMSMEQLESYIEDNDLGIDPNIYEGDITRLREAIILAEKDPEAFEEAYKADVETYNFNKQLSDLNETETENTEKAEETEADNSEKDPNIDDLLGDMGEETETDEG